MSANTFSSILKAIAHNILPPGVRRVLRRCAVGDSLQVSNSYRNQIDELKILSAQALIRHSGSFENIRDIREAEFKVFSQFGEDGIIQYLISKTHIEDETFIEFGVGDYAESNTQFLLMNNNWKGLIIDRSEQCVNSIKSSEIYWRHDLTAVCAFVDKDNINQIMSDHSFSGQIGLLNIDVDGNDYWIWESITVVDPIIVIIEYNSTFGNKYAITIPYDPLFERGKAHYSHLYWGCSLKALCLLAEKKGYYFVGSNSNGNNAFFVRKDRTGSIQPVTVESGYVKSKFRDSRDPRGQLSFVGGDERIKVIQDVVVYDLERCELVKIKDLGELMRWEPC